MTTLTELFRQQVARTPTAVAVRCAGTSVSYATLDRRANQLAHHLIGLGAGPESVIGVSLERGVELVVALLAIHKTGGAYLPLDPDYPLPRIRYMRADSRAETVITSATFASLDGPDHDPAVPVLPAHPAYVIYTSGSTGRPKGVVIDHRGIVNRLRWMQDEYGLGADDRVLQKTPYSFDVSVWEFFWPLITGAALVVARPGGHRDPAYLASVIAAEGITTIHFVPSMLRTFLAEPVGALPSLRRLLCSGEALTAGLVADAAGRIGCEVHNLYGPTEASVDVTAIRCLPGEPVTIGRPIANTCVRIVDADLDPVPEGELCISGVQLARGYLGRPGLTADRFVPNPFGDGDRLYRTGDRARWRPDGTIDYLGRLDHQVKIRGHRVELGEVESVLCGHPAVHAAAVTVHRPGDLEPRLVAHVVPVGPADVASLRAHLAGQLPEHMVPALFLILPKLPLTPSGKTDRAALPAPGGTRPELRVAYASARSATEATLVEVWEQVLEIAPVGIRDPFLELGGQSLAAARICARVRQRFGGHVSAADLLEAVTVERMAQLVAAAPAGPPPITRIGS
ncbi:amino acid adenylation domain-containing protein [Amycolatopsis sp. PS_44_ISF1]|uniref:amino acid adenylation domain-containing protein n=1 Tax=Amycolatopsis sp. PS_44_ISF1 TaxID=2974917 RepID=UPI0028DEAE88|nr:amino acid adenylation domain-containing protein [Amycolatopsis sp. PS_44_ISF1]MDT8912931.1 amino acid adenylation domain-containing protein [Amycolatopsis sp. PS_44_ISF1]